MKLRKSQRFIAIIYLGLLVVGACLAIYFPNSSLLMRLFIIDLILTAVVFAISWMIDNASTYDLYWSVIPFYFIFYWWAFYPLTLLDFRLVAAVTLLSIWSWRLSFNWFRGWKGFDHEDWRYSRLKEQTGRLYPLVNFLGIHLFPTLLVFFGSIPLMYIFSTNAPFSWSDVAGALIMFAGIGFESLADKQLFDYKGIPQNKGKTIDTGLWRYTRHPNYFGEILIWGGLFVLSLGTGIPWYWGLGALLMILLFWFISIPMIEKRMSHRYSDYGDYKKRTSKLIPFFPRKS